MSCEEAYFDFWPRNEYLNRAERGASEEQDVTLFGWGSFGDRAREWSARSYIAQDITNFRIDFVIQEKAWKSIGHFNGCVNRRAGGWVILDNATVHHSQKIQDLITSAGAIILYLSPYSPDKNPIELMFNEWKKVLRRQEFNPSWYDTHIQGVRAVTPQWRGPSSDIAESQVVRDFLRREKLL
jgi:hypothetical protein